MYITSREREIIHLLLLCQDGITVSEIAQKIGLSQRTIHRALKQVAMVLTKHEMMLEKKAGVGLRLQGTNENRNELKMSLLKQASDFTAKEREELILLTLFKSTDVTKLAGLANDFKVTIGTIGRDLDKIAVYLKAFKIELIRKKGHGISLSGTEQQKRNAWGYFLAMQFNEYEFLEMLKNPRENQRSLLEIIQIEKLTLAHQLIREMTQRHDLQLTDHTHMTLTIHLSFAILRMAQNQLIMIDDHLLDELRNDDKYTIALDMAAVIQEMFKIEIPDAELGYLTIHLKGARLRASVLNQRDKRTSVYTLACRALIVDVSQRLQVPFEKDSAVLEGLLKHIEPAVYRLERGLDLYNPLATRIMSAYPKLFEATKEGLEKCFDHLQFPDGEIAYVVLYFGASHLLYGAKETVKLAVICPSGLGASKMLAQRIKKEIPDVDEVMTLSLVDLQLATLSDFDVVLSTVEMTAYSGQYLLVSPILSDLEIERIRKYFKACTQRTEVSLLEGMEQKENQKAFQIDIKKAFQKINIYSDAVLKLLEGFHIHDLHAHVHSNEVVNDMLGILWADQLVTDREGVRVDLKRRESLGGFGLPKTQIALYHCRTAWVQQSIFRAFRLDSAISVKAMDGKLVDVTSLLLVLTPLDALEIELELLSVISTAVIEDERSIRLFTVGNKASIVEYLSCVFYQKFQMIFKK